MLLQKSAVAVVTTNTTSETIVATYSMPASTMGANGLMKLWFAGSQTSSANNKTWRVRFGGIGGTIVLTVPAMTTTASFILDSKISNRNSESSQHAAFIAHRGTDALQSGVIATGLTVNTAAALDVVITCQMAALAETMTLDSYLIELIR